jgi:anaerobilin synthase
MNREKRYRSHHDAEHALRGALNIRSGRPAGPPMAGSREVASMEQLLNQKPGKEPRGVYLHTPYCDTICTFCNMNRKMAPRTGLGQYAALLTHELSIMETMPYIKGRDFEVVYFGGGTPTVFIPADLDRVLTAFTRAIPITRNTEWTVETTLHNLSDEKIEMLRNAGVNRLSVGIQTFADRGRKLLGRTGDQESIVTRMEQVRRNFDGVLGIDIIYSYPGQTVRELNEDLLWIKRLGIDGVSFYSLMIQEDSTLHRRITEGTISFERSIDEDRKLHNLFYEGLLDQGFSLLELTKAVQPGRDSYRYIKIRYNNGDLLPLGMGAGGRIGGYQIYRMAPGRDMIAPVNTAFDKYHLLLGHLQFGRYDLEELLAHSPDCPREYIKHLLKKYAAQGLLKKEKTDSWRLSSEGVFWGNNLAIDFMLKVIKMSGKSQRQPISV